MSVVGERFIASIGRPDPPLAPGLHFSRSIAAEEWKTIHAEIGAGWYLDRFLFLFAEGVQKLQACLDAWAFLVPPHPDRMVLGRNAYGAILTLENANTSGAPERVGVLDPLLVKYWTEPPIFFANLLGNWLPQRRIPNFFVEPTYNLWVKSNGAYLDDEVILAAETPFGLGGTWHPSNFNEENVVTYYETTGPIYARAFADPGRT